jgi:SAM-dependent methyltransferase
MRLFRRRPAPKSIPPRDTDMDWGQIGEQEPYFGVLTHERFLKTNMTDDDKAEFFQSGSVDIEQYVQTLRTLFGEFSPKSALDFGCGVGRLTRALADATGDAIGVDVSEGMLREARQHSRPGLEFSSALPMKMKAFDWLVSIIVFQHIAPDRGYSILRDLLDRLAPRGCVTLHFTFFRDERFSETAGVRLAPGHDLSIRSNPAALENLAPGAMAMFDYDLSIVVALLFQAGVEKLYLDHADHGGFHGAIIYGRMA